jgi:hypothetical protein
MTEKITLQVNMPDVTVDPYRIEVRCGETSVEVYEHGLQGSGDWAAWKANGYIIGNGGKVGYTQEQALNDARLYVHEQERRRLLSEQLVLTLDATAQDEMEQQ